MTPSARIHTGRMQIFFGGSAAFGTRGQHAVDFPLNISAESVRELIVAYNNKGLCSKRWKSAEEMVDAIEDEFFIQILPVKREHMKTYSRLIINEAQGHKDPSDHVIIAHAITERMPLISSDTRFEFYRSQGLDLIFNKK